MDDLKSIPDNLLKASFDRAKANHDWSKPLPVPAIVAAYKQLIIEDRERIERERYINERRNPDTVACRLCGDTGYAALAVWCRSFNDWRTGRAPCECEATPLPQRRSSLIDPSEWKRDDFGTWFPPTPAASPDCTCLFCKNAPRGQRNDNYSNGSQGQANNPGRFAERSAGRTGADSAEYRREWHEADRDDDTF